MYEAISNWASHSLILQWIKAQISVKEKQQKEVHRYKVTYTSSHLEIWPMNQI